MNKDRPVINHIELILDGEWVTRTFLPFYEDQLIWAEDVKRRPSGCSGCSLDVYIHPMVQDEHDENMHHKLCTLTVIKAGLVTAKEIIGTGR